MTRSEIEKEVLQALTSVAPELDAASLVPNTPLRDQVDLDSMDFLRFVIELHKQLGIEVLETDYPKLASLDEAVNYLAARLAPTPSS